MRIYPALLIGMLVTSCIPDPLEVKDIPTVKPEIVVTTQIIPSQSLVVLLTKTFGALDASDDSDPTALLDQIAVNDATVVLESDNTIDTLLFLGNGVYGGISLSLLEEAVYHLKVNSISLGEVTATTVVKRQILFESIEVDLYFDGFDDTLAQITYTLKDPPGENFYMINVQKFSRDIDLQERLLNPRVYTRLINDEVLDGTTFGEVFRSYQGEYATGDTVAVFLSNISKEYYDFIQLRQDNRYSLVEFISEPINYPSNVVGGKGFFNLYIPDVRFFIIDNR